MKYVLVLMLFAPLIAAADCSTNWMQCSSDSRLQINSFEMRATDTITAITTARDRMTIELQRRPIRDAAQKKALLARAKSVLAKTDNARALWQKARDACHADTAGNCATPADTAKASALLAQAQEAIR